MSAESILSALKITMWRYLMAHRPILNDKQRNTLFSIPTREHELLQYYVLSNEDIFHINTKRKVSNRLGFALQLCAFRYPGRLLQKNEIIPLPTLMFLAAQLGISEDEFGTYGIRSETKYEHSSEYNGTQKLDC